MQMREILTAGVDARLLGGRPLHLDLLKLDGDGPEAAWLEEERNSEPGSDSAEALQALQAQLREERRRTAEWQHAAGDREVELVKQIENLKGEVKGLKWVIRQYDIHPYPNEQPAADIDESS